jgi:hypothetical protein
MYNGNCLTNINAFDQTKLDAGALIGSRRARSAASAYSSQVEIN